MAAISKPRWAPMAAAMSVLLLAYGAWQVFRWPNLDRTIVGDLFFVPVGIAAIVAALGAAGRCRERPRIRSAWRLLALGAALYLGGGLAQTRYEFVGPLPFPSIADLLYLVFYPVMLVGLRRFPAQRADRRETVRLALDLTVVALGGAMLVTYIVLGPTLRQGGSATLATVVSVAYPVGDMILFLGLGSALLRRSDASSARALQFLTAGLAFFVAADVAYGYITLHLSYDGGDPVDTLWMVAVALTAVAGAAQTEPGPGPGLSLVEREGAPQASWAPYLATAVGFGLLIVDHGDLWVTIAAVVLACLVAGRQFLAQRELVAHQRRAHHLSLHDALTGLRNRRGLIADLSAALAAGTDSPARFIAGFDLDGFKAYNDTFGHLAGDRLLERLAGRLREAIGRDGQAYRLGGDEFCVLLAVGVADPQTVLAAAGAALCETGRGFAIGASGGVVSIPSEADELSATLHLADTRMYAQKNGRRAATIISQTRDVLLRATAEHAVSLPEHMLEVGELARRVALELGLAADAVDLTLRAGELHDVGKIAIPETIINKPGPLDEEEWTYMREHTLIGQRVLDAAPALRPVAAIVRSAHERFDGSGYPDGLAGERIPLPARIVFACDAYHAMIDTRPYAAPRSEAAARAELRRGAGSQFDPAVVTALLTVLERLDLATANARAGEGPGDPAAAGRSGQAAGAASRPVAPTAAR